MRGTARKKSGKNERIYRNIRNIDFFMFINRICGLHGSVYGQLSNNLIEKKSNLPRLNDNTFLEYCITKIIKVKEMIIN